MILILILAISILIPGILILILGCSVWILIEFHWVYKGLRHVGFPWSCMVIDFDSGNDDFDSGDYGIDSGAFGF